MDTGKLNDYTYYEGYEGEPEFILSAGDESIHIWDGYINDIFGTPVMDGTGWKGLTRDFNEVTGPFDADEPCLIDVNEYLDDAIKYRDRMMDYEETPNVLEALINWLNEHADVEVFASVDQHARRCFGYNLGTNERKQDGQEAKNETKSCDYEREMRDFIACTRLLKELE